MIWLWITAGIVITLFLLRKKNISFHHFIWVLLPIDFYGVNIGVTIKPYMLFAMLILLLNIIAKRKIKLMIKMEWAAGLLSLFLVVLLADLFNESNGASLLQQAMFLLVVVCAFIYIGSIQSYDEVQQIRDVIVATAIGFGVVYLVAVFTNMQDLDLAGISTLVREDPGIIMKFADVPEGRLRGFSIDPNAFATSLIPAMTFSIYQLFGQKKEKKVLYIVQVIITLICCYYTRSRGALLTFLLIILFTTISGIKIKKLGIGFVSVLLLLCMVTLATTVFADEEASIVMELIWQQYEGRADFSDAYGRGTVWQSAWDILNEKNLFFGVGQGRVSELSVLQLDSHNTWLEWIAGNGIIAGSLVDLYFGLVFIRFSRYCGKRQAINDYLDFLLGVKWAYAGIAIMLLSVSNITNSYLIFTASLMISLMSEWKHENSDCPEGEALPQNGSYMSIAYSTQPLRGIE
ncbi:MAG: O-antigen ligase family protein [Negativicutes bacterium]|nr:O-antigen ligase family protein [Negativicutes bacterium]